MSLRRISILNQYQERHILLTGATGFLGKVLLAMMLDRLPNIGCIYVLIRRNKQYSALERFIQETLSSPVFSTLQKKQQAEFTNFITQRVRVLEGDVTLPDLGLNAALTQHLQENIDLVINAAGLIDFSPDIRHGLNINVYGTLHVANFVSQCKHAALLHISTCYVAGNSSTLMEEHVETHKAPNGNAFNAETELSTLQDHIQQITHGNQHCRSYRRPLTALGHERATQWGWSNTYCYTKALAEYLLVMRYPNLRLTIVRPSIVESAVNFPFQGWNEGLNTSAPFCYLLGGWYPYVTARKNYILDIIPVDYASNAILVIGAAALSQVSAPVYQLASSCNNPLYIGFVAELCRKWHQQYWKKTGLTWYNRHLRTLKPIKCIGPKHVLGPERLLNLLTKVQPYLNNKLMQPFKDKLEHMKQILQRINKIHVLFRPFVHDNLHQFAANAIEQLLPEEEFKHAIKQLDWKNYWLNIHMPGMNQWIYPLYKGKKIEFSSTGFELTAKEKALLFSLPHMEYAHNGSNRTLLSS